MTTSPYVALSTPSEQESTRQEPSWMSRLGPEQRARVLEGRSLLDPRRIGSIVGVAGGLVFVLANIGFAGGGLRIALSTAALALALGVLAALFVRPRALGAPASVSPAAWWVYLASVTGMLGLIAVFRLVLAQTGHEAAIPVAIAIAVGAHFFPFAAAFRERHFIDLGAVLVGLGVIGTTLGVLLAAPWGAASAVLVGLVMLTLMLAYAVRGRALSAPAHHR